MLYPLSVWHGLCPESSSLTGGDFLSAICEFNIALCPEIQAELTYDLLLERYKSTSNSIRNLASRAGNIHQSQKSLRSRALDVCPYNTGTVEEQIEQYNTASKARYWCYAKKAYVQKTVSHTIIISKLLKLCWHYSRNTHISVLGENSVVQNFKFNCHQKSSAKHFRLQI